MKTNFSASTLLLRMVIAGGVFLLQAFLLLPAQTIEWEQNYGGSEREYPYVIKPTSDSGYIVAGGSQSSDSMVSANYGLNDCWVVKLNETGSVEWEQNYGGSDHDIARDIQQTPDGGYIMVGQSSSSDTDVVENYGIFDFWVVKLDSVGNLQWEENYGGSNTDVAMVIQQTEDNGFIVGGSTYSNDSMVSVNYGLADFWVIKIDSIGNLLWEESYGGSESETPFSILKTTEENYIIAGESRSSDTDVTENFGSRDCWIIEIDSAGNLLWEDNYGGSGDERANSIHRTSDNGYIVGGYTESSDSMVSANYGSWDSWVFKLDSIGILQWEQNYGGSGPDLGRALRLTDDGGYIQAGDSQSDDFDVSDNYGSADYWVTKLDDSGNIQWKQNYGGSEYDLPYSLQNTTGGDYIVAGYTSSSDSDVTVNFGKQDFWVIKLSCGNATSSTINPTSCGQYTSPSGKYVWTTSNTYFDTIPNRAGCDSFITINLTVNKSSASTISPTACDKYTVPSGDTTYTTSGTYTDTITNTLGCDSIISINLTIDTLDTTVTQIGDTLTAQGTGGASYQWLDCNKDYATVSGATSASFAPDTTGKYAAQIVQDSCADTTSCHSVTVVGVDEAEMTPEGMEVFPNPTSGVFYLHFKRNHSQTSEQSSIEVKVYNVTGETVRYSVIAGENRKYRIDLSEEPEGLYIVSVNANHQVWHRQLLIH